MIQQYPDIARYCTVDAAVKIAIMDAGTPQKKLSDKEKLLLMPSYINYDIFPYVCAILLYSLIQPSVDSYY
jgi:hypothetical protein